MCEMDPKEDTEERSCISALYDSPERRLPNFRGTYIHGSGAAT